MEDQPLNQLSLFDDLYNIECAYNVETYVLLMKHVKKTEQAKLRKQQRIQQAYAKHKIKTY